VVQPTVSNRRGADDGTEMTWCIKWEEQMGYVKSHHAANIVHVAGYFSEIFELPNCLLSDIFSLAVVR
jgi:hypothetical protein